MIIKTRYPNYVSVLTFFVFFSWIINEFEIDYVINVATDCNMIVE